MICSDDDVLCSALLSPAQLSSALLCFDVLCFPPTRIPRVHASSVALINLARGREISEDESKRDETNQTRPTRPDDQTR
ncbi:hypothetical protein M0802_004110 [Mischocyttarus mexicanus]|nr:hypothetical protein M0802_004110 [Mischocyttarus mexicanus]